jgi:hypothetical protein
MNESKKCCQTDYKDESFVNSGLVTPHMLWEQCFVDAKDVKSSTFDLVVMM